MNATLTAPPAACPKCGWAKVFDNRGNKTNAKSPDLKCGNPACDWRVWPPKTGAVPPAGPVAAAFAAPPVPVAAQTLPGFLALATTYAMTLQHVLSNVVPIFGSRGIPVTMEGIAAITAHLNIERNKRGV